MMYELRAIAVGCALWLLSCAGGAGESRSETERGRASALERQRVPTESGSRDAVSGAGRGEVVSPGGSEPGTLGSNTNWRPLDPLRRGNPPLLPLDPDDPDEVLDPDDPDPGGEEPAPDTTGEPSGASSSFGSSPGDLWR